MPIPTPEKSSTLQPLSTTSAAVTYCPSTGYCRLTISFLLCTEYDNLQPFERTDILRKVSTFTSIPITRMSIYRIYVPGRRRAYGNVRGPPGFTCNSKTKLDHSLADPGGWIRDYNGYQTSVDLYFTCEHAQIVANLVKKIKYEISLNRLHGHVGTHVIGWVLHRWHCSAPTTTTSPQM